MGARRSSAPSSSGPGRPRSGSGRQAHLAEHFWQRWGEAIGGADAWRDRVALRWQGTATLVPARIGFATSTESGVGEARLWVAQGGRMRLQIYWPRPRWAPVLWIATHGEAWSLAGEGSDTVASRLTGVQRRAAQALALWGLCGPVTDSWRAEDAAARGNLAFAGERGGAGVDRPAQLFAVWSWTWPDGIDSHLQLDRATGLPAGWRWSDGGGRAGELIWSGYRRLGEHTLPFQMRLYPQVGAVGWRFDWERVEIDPPLPATLFFVPTLPPTPRVQAGSHSPAAESRIPVRWLAGCPYVQGRVNGRGPFWFALELGQAGSAIWEWAIPDTPPGSALLLELPGLQLASWSARRIPVAGRADCVVPSPTPRQPLAGWIGADVWRHLVVELDGPGRLLRLWDRAEMAVASGRSLAANESTFSLRWWPSVSSGWAVLQPNVPHVGPGEPPAVAVQSSAAWALAVLEAKRTAPVAGELALASARGREEVTPRDPDSVEVRGFPPRVVAWEKVAPRWRHPELAVARRLRDWRLGRQAWTNVWCWQLPEGRRRGPDTQAGRSRGATEPERAGGGLPSLVVGGALVQTACWLWDYPHHLVRLRAERSPLVAGFRPGLPGVRWETRADGSIWVAAVQEESAQWHAGLRAGQRLIALDGVEASSWSVLEIEESLAARDAVELDVWSSPGEAGEQRPVHLALPLRPTLGAN